MGFVLTGAGENNQFTAKPEVQPVFPWKEDGEDGRQLTPLGGSNTKAVCCTAKK